MQLLDPVSGSPDPPRGSSGGLTTGLLPDGSAITPDDVTVYDPPIFISVWDSTPKTVAIVPYGRQGDALISYPTKNGSKLPVLVRQVLATGTTATVIRGQSVYVAGTFTFGLLTDEFGDAIVTETSDPIILESGS